MHTLSLLIVYPPVFILSFVLMAIHGCVKWLDDKNMELVKYYNHEGLWPTYAARDKRTKQADIKKTMDASAKWEKIREKDRQMGKKYMYSPARLAKIREMKNVRW